MQERNKISIIIPVYNVEDYLDECILSVVNQTYRNIEIILVNDGSTDRSKEICEKYAVLDNRIIVINKENGGLSSARNAGISKATGEFISFIDSDDYIETTMLDSLRQIIEKYNADIVECSFFDRFTNNTNHVTEMSQKEALHRYISSSYYYPNVSVCNKLYRKEVVSGLRFPEGRIHEDYLYQCQAICRCNKFIFVDTSFYNYRVRENSITHKRFDKKDFDKLTIYKERTSFLRQWGDEESVDLSSAEEFVILFSLFWKASINKMSESEEIKTELLERKEEFNKLNFSLKRRVIYRLFYFNPHMYIWVRNVLDKFIKKF